MQQVISRLEMPQYSNIFLSIKKMTYFFKFGMIKLLLQVDFKRLGLPSQNPLHQVARGHVQCHRYCKSKSTSIQTKNKKYLSIFLFDPI